MGRPGKREKLQKSHVRKRREHAQEMAYCKAKGQQAIRLAQQMTGFSRPKAVQLLVKVTQDLLAESRGAKRSYLKMLYAQNGRGS